MYEVSTIYLSDHKAMTQVDALLQKKHLQRDQNLDYICGIFNGAGELIATGSAFRNSLRCFAVDSRYQGEGLLNTIVTHLLEIQQERGCFTVYLCTKPASARFFANLGFYEIARVEGQLIFMENDSLAFDRYLQKLQTETRSFLKQQPITTAREDCAIVMNSNPLTNGHLHLIKTAAQQARLLHIFLVREDLSFFPYTVRRQILTAALQDIPNILLHDTDNYLISGASFPSYFLGDHETVSQVHAELDCQIFVKIARCLDIHHRYVGDEPFSKVTSIYNNVMQRILPAFGINLHVIPRKEYKGQPISASQIRQIIHDTKFPLETSEATPLRNLLPPATLDFLHTAAAQPILEAIRNATEVRHH